MIMVCVSTDIINARVLHVDVRAQAVDQFDFVAVNEFFDESLLLLHMQLRIKIVDLLYLPSKNFSDPELPISAEIEQKILDLNPHDLEIHRYAVARLNATIQDLEPTFSVMLQRFRQLKEEALSSCREFDAQHVGHGDERMSFDQKRQRQMCLEHVCLQNQFCVHGSFAPFDDATTLGAMSHCFLSLLGDGYCDEENDSAACDFDGGDCRTSEL